MITFEPDARAIVGLIATVLVGFTVGYAVNRVGKSLPIDAPNAELEPSWQRMRELRIAGYWIGHIERPIFFMALWMPGGWPIVATWLAFKLAYYWQSASYWAFPPEVPTPDQAAYIVAKRQLGANHVATALVGTGLNILIPLLAVVIARSFVISPQVTWVPF